MNEMSFLDSLLLTLQVLFKIISLFWPVIILAVVLGICLAIQENRPEKPSRTLNKNPSGPSH